MSLLSIVLFTFLRWCAFPFCLWGGAPPLHFDFQCPMWPHLSHTESHAGQLACQGAWCLVQFLHWLFEVVFFWYCHFDLLVTTALTSLLPPTLTCCDPCSTALKLSPMVNSSFLVAVRGAAKSLHLSSISSSLIALRKHCCTSNSIAQLNQKFRCLWKILNSLWWSGASQSYWGWSTFSYKPTSLDIILEPTMPSVYLLPSALVLGIVPEVVTRVDVGVVPITVTVTILLKLRLQ